MIAKAADDALGEYDFTEAHFRQIADLAHRRYGLNLAETKKPLVYSRLARRLRARGLADFSAYLELIKRDGETEEETAFVSALTTNVTSFFRENHYFELLQGRGLPVMARQLEAGQRVRLWSAGCSSGEEPYSLAMTLLEHLPGAARRDVRILATDIDPAVVSMAQAGRYSDESVATIPQALRDRYVTGSGDPRKPNQMAPSVRDMVKIAELNLMTDWPFKGPFDAIFCRNVAIYFDKPTQARLWERFVGLLREGGLLFIGHSERVTGPATAALETIGITAYAKRTNPK
ncbi:protein-glutamate O-methyltransferase [Aestuariicoccus sp. MJ-SS9]|uniref:CheR family methyltransferase n=1 Tax=Aestuariicoccus sp. MJ-SS9 TaxID=3079855 RepID=UPI002910FA87|nr:protein-glutamate O-methyltransferase [Aestuariicoccus sp. MJ-SS9]MDU8912383.1 protein-glutamate O-methyltransferase [Aestuariicoccus sp. MJ-SS9]